MDFWEFRDWRRRRDERHRRLDDLIGGRVQDVRRVHTIMVRRDPLTYFNDEDFFELFRFQKADFSDYLVPKFGPDLDIARKQRARQGGVRSGQGPRPLTASQELAIGLAFLASGSFQHIAGHVIGVSRPTANAAVNRVTKVICQRKDEFIRLPSSAEMRHLSDVVFDEFRIPSE